MARGNYKRDCITLKIINKQEAGPAVLNLAVRRGLLSEKDYASSEILEDAQGKAATLSVYPRPKHRPGQVVSLRTTVTWRQGITPGTVRIRTPAEGN